MTRVNIKRSPAVGGVPQIMSYIVVCCHRLVTFIDVTYKNVSFLYKYGKKTGCVIMRHYHVCVKIVFMAPGIINSIFFSAQIILFGAPQYLHDDDHIDETIFYV